MKLKPAATDHDYCDVPNVMELSEFKTSAISYIAGYVVRMDGGEKNPLFEMFSHVDNDQREDSRPVCGVEIQWWSKVALSRAAEDL